MIEQWETNFPENNASKRMADERYTLLNSLRKEFCHSQEFKLSTIIQNEIDDDEVIYFDLINENPSSELVKSKIQEKVAENFQETHPDKKSTFSALDEPVSIKPLPLPSLTEDTEDLLFILLVYLDQVLYLDEMSEKLKKLEFFINKGKIEQVNSIAHSCIFISLNCGMNSSIKPLRNLSEIKNSSQPAILKTLWKQIKKNFEDFKFELNKYLEQIKMAIHEQTFR